MTAITLNNDVLKSYDRHYENVYGFNAIAYVDAKTEARQRRGSGAQEQGATTAQVYMKNYMMEQPKAAIAVLRIVVPSTTRRSQMYHVNPVSGGAFDLSTEGVGLPGVCRPLRREGRRCSDQFDGRRHQMHEVPILGSTSSG